MLNALPLYYVGERACSVFQFSNGFIDSKNPEAITE